MIFTSERVNEFFDRFDTEKRWFRSHKYSDLGGVPNTVFGIE